MVLVTYDVNVETREGRRRLRRVAKICVNYGQRVQNSVFECLLDPAKLVALKNELLKEIDPSLTACVSINWERIGIVSTRRPKIVISEGPLSYNTTKF